ncbi:glycerate kinase [Vanessa cardui]|uniref:glycerate kinase n=1 Tax=Vanessa cardui TaxID=171605 RepID=UPI001F133CF5|nr:glycerate kinase [Vanessa cardui]
MSKVIFCDLLQIFKSSVSAVLPENLIKKSINYSPVTQKLSIGGENYNLEKKNVYIIGAGKAVQNMAIEMENMLNSKIKQGIISIPTGSIKTKLSENNNIQYLEGAKNNLPDETAMTTTRKIKDLVSKLTHDDFLLVLLSGGGSALLSLPKEPINLQEKTALIKKLANSGADIKELNTVRKWISDIKGGKLAMYAEPAQIVTLILSDVVGDPIDMIASGPTVHHDDNPMEAINIINKFKLYNDLPLSIKTVLEDKNHTKTFPNDKVKNIILGSNKLSIKAATSKAYELNYMPIELSNIVTGNVGDLVQEYVNLVKIFCDFRNGNDNISILQSKLKTLNIPGFNLNFAENTNELSSIRTKDLCLILGGETTVNVNGSGLGGRNQQLALEFSKALSYSSNEFKDHEIYFLSAGTDGIDGPTDAAGAIGHLNLISECKQANIDVDMYINNNDSYNFYKKFNNGELHVVIGHTNTNVMDIHLIIIKKVCKST